MAQHTKYPKCCCLLVDVLDGGVVVSMLLTNNKSTGTRQSARPSQRFNFLSATSNRRRTTTQKLHCHVDVGGGRIGNKFILNPYLLNLSTIHHFQHPIFSLSHSVVPGTYKYSHVTLCLLGSPPQNSIPVKVSHGQFRRNIA